MNTIPHPDELKQWRDEASARAEALRLQINALRRDMSRERRSARRLHRKYEEAIKP